jgi:hypothetical protein
MKIAYLEAGPLLDYWVGKAQGLQVEIAAPNGPGSEVCVTENRESFSPSTSWAQAGPIIDREKIDLMHDFGRWMARHSRRDDYSRADVSPLVTAMRAYLMWEYGDELPSAPAAASVPPAPGT